MTRRPISIGSGSTGSDISAGSGKRWPARRAVNGIGPGHTLGRSRARHHHRTKAIAIRRARLRRWWKRTGIGVYRRWSAPVTIRDVAKRCPRNNHCNPWARQSNCYQAVMRRLLIPRQPCSGDGFSHSAQQAAPISFGGRCAYASCRHSQDQRLGVSGRGERASGNCCPGRHRRALPVAPAWLGRGLCLARTARQLDEDDAQAQTAEPERERVGPHAAAIVTAPVFQFVRISLLHA